MIKATKIYFAFIYLRCIHASLLEIHRGFTDLEKARFCCRFMSFKIWSVSPDLIKYFIYSDFKQLIPDYIHRLAKMI